MPRANQYFSPSFLWHITHRCHKKEFLLKFARDRECWLFEAKRRYGLCVLNYVVTSNPIHYSFTGERHKPARHRQKPAVHRGTDCTGI